MRKFLGIFFILNYLINPAHACSKGSILSRVVPLGGPPNNLVFEEVLVATPRAPSPVRSRTPRAPSPVRSKTQTFQAAMPEDTQCELTVPQFTEEDNISPQRTDVVDVVAPVRNELSIRIPVVVREKFSPTLPGTASSPEDERGGSLSGIPLGVESGEASSPILRGSPATRKLRELYSKYLMEIPRVLIVSENSRHQSILSKFFRLRGFRVSVPPQVSGVLELIRGTTDQYSLVVVDFENGRNKNSHKLLDDLNRVDYFRPNNFYFLGISAAKEMERDHKAEDGFHFINQSLNQENLNAFFSTFITTSFRRLDGFMVIEIMAASERVDSSCLTTGFGSAPRLN